MFLTFQKPHIFQNFQKCIEKNPSDFLFSNSYIGNILYGFLYCIDNKNKVYNFYLSWNDPYDQRMVTGKLKNRLMFTYFLPQ